MNAPLRLIYVFNAGVLKQKSVQHKIYCQIRELRAHGIDAKGWFFNTLEGPEREGTHNEFIDKFPLPRYTKKHRFFNAHHRNQFHYQYIAGFLDAHSDSYDIIFLRQNGNGKGWEEIINTVGDKTYMYTPSNRLRETYCERRYAKKESLLSSIISWYGYFRFWLREKRLLKHFVSKLKGVVTFTPEFGQIIQKDSLAKVGLIYNRDGVDTGTVPPRSIKERKGEEVKMIFLKGSNQEQKWAGLDRLISSIESYPDLPFRLYITGNANKDPQRYGRPFVTLTGRLPNDELEELIDDVDLGVSNLENYLIHFSETTNLKSRDYYSRGLPFIQSNTMPDIEGTKGERYYLRVSNDDSIIDMQEVYDFAMRMRTEREHPQKMHDFAVSHLDWNITVGELAETIKKDY